jgi:hypothetical protein
MGESQASGGARWESKDCRTTSDAVLAATLDAATTAVAAGVVAGSTPVTWTSTSGVDASTGTLQATSGGWGSAGAISNEVIPSSSAEPQGVTFKCSAGDRMMAGLAATSRTTSYTDIDFAFYCEMNSALDIFESDGASGRSTRVGNFGTWTGDEVFGVQVTGTTVKYLKDGLVLHTSTRAATFPLHVDASIYDVGATLSDVALYVAPEA